MGEKTWRDLPGAQLTITDRAPLPDAPGCTSGVVAVTHTVCSVQCSVCHRVVTGKPIFATGWALFVPDEGERGRPPYRRCRDCVAAKRHPQIGLFEVSS